MKKVSFITLIFLIFITSLYSSSWKGGYKVSISGYHTDVITQQEHLAIDLVYLPLLNSNASLSFYGGYSFSNLFFPVTHTIRGGLSFSHLMAQDHLFDSLFIRDSALWATIDVNVMSELPTFRPTFINLSLSPFSLNFGDKFITVGSIILNYHISMKEFDWGVKLFELTHYMW